MIHMCHRGTKSLVAKMDDKANRCFWKNYFYMQIEHIVANPAGFPETWNFAREFSFAHFVIFLKTIADRLLLGDIAEDLLLLLQLRNYLRR